MEPRGNRLGFFALILAGVALVIAFSGRHSGYNMSVPAAPVPPVPFNAGKFQAEAQREAARAQADADRALAKAQAEADRALAKAQAPRSWDDRGPWREREHRGPFFFGPLFVLGNLVRVLLAIALIGFGIRLLRRGRGRRGPGNGSGSPGTPIGPVFDA